LPHLWLGYAAFGVIAIVVYYLLPAERQSTLYTVIGVSAALAVIVGVLVHRPAAPLGWLLLAAGQVSYATGDIVYFIIDEGIVIDLLYLGMYLLITLALVVFVRRRIPRGDAATIIDPAVLAIAAGAVWWVYLIAPLAADSEATVFVIAYPIFDLIVLAVALRLVLGTGARTPAFRLLAGGLALMLGTDVIYAVKSAEGTFAEGTWIDAGWILSYVALGAAALHPSMRWLDTRSPAVSPRIGRARLVVLVGGTLLPVLMLVAPGRAGVDQLPVVVAAAALLVVLVVTRLVAMSTSERERAIVDPLTGLHAMGVFRANVTLEGERALRGNGQLGLVMLELDHFRLIAETYGQPAADRVLFEVADRLRALCRPDDLIARTGKHGFGVLLPGADGYWTARFAEVVREAVADPRISLEPGVSVRVTASVGLAALPDDVQTPGHLLRVAEQSVDAARAAGGNRSHGLRGQLNVSTLAMRR
jgi:two-component system, cell cycle response regulator